MKYRIKTKKRESCSSDIHIIKEYYPQVKTLIGWFGIDYDGESSYIIDQFTSSRKEALKRINLHRRYKENLGEDEFENITHED